MDGWSALGNALGGGLGQLEQDAYMRQMLSNQRSQTSAARAGKAMEDERKARLSRIALEGMKDNLEPLGLSQFAGVLQAGQGNAQQLVNAILGAREFTSRDAATAAALGGDLPAANAQLLGLANGPVDLTKIAGGVAYNPLGTPEQQSMRQTPLGQAEVALRGAQAADEYASAGRNQAIGEAALLRAAPKAPAPAPLGAVPGAPMPAPAPKPLTPTEQKAQAANSLKAAQVAALDRGMQRIRDALEKINQGRVFNTGPMDQYVSQFTPEGQELVAAVGQIRPSLMALTRVPGVGAQSDLEARLEGLRFPGLEFDRGVNDNTLRDLAAFVDDLKMAYGSIPGQLQDMQDQLGSAGSTGIPQPGQIEDGFRFRGGNPADPKNWEPI